MPPSPAEGLLSEEWRRTAQRYSARQLTLSKDRLNAIAAVASHFAEAAGLLSSEYVAGLWKPFLVRALLWSVRADRSGRRRAELTGRPSWSWASILLAVEWYPEMWETRMHQETAQVLDAQAKVANALLPFGAVESGRLAIDGLLTSIALPFPSGEARFRHGDSDSEHSVKLILNYDDKTEDALSVWLLELLLQMGQETLMGPGSDNRFGLVLKPTGHGNLQFTRIGIYREWILQNIPSENVKPRNDKCERCKSILGAESSKLELV